MKVKPILTKQDSEFRWRPNGSYSSNIVKGLSKIRFISDGTGTACPIFWTQTRVDFDIELSQLMRAEVANGNFVEIWEDVYSSLLKLLCKPEYLSAVAAAGVPVAIEQEHWPIFSHNREIVSDFRKHLPKDSQKEYLLYLRKQWNQMSHPDNEPKPDFGTWCDEELKFLNTR